MKEAMRSCGSDVPLSFLKGEHGVRTEEIVRKICECAAKYRQQLANKNYMVIYNAAVNPQELEPEMLEIIFNPRNFLHLTGVLTSMSPAQFYKVCAASKLKPSDFSKPSNGTHEQKLKVLGELVCLHKSCKMIGGFNGNGFYLETSRVMGNVRGAMGFVESEQNSNFFAPNTVLQGDVRDRVCKPHRILAMLRKQIKEARYERVCYVAKGVELCDISQFLQSTGRCAENLIIE